MLYSRNLIALFTVGLMAVPVFAERADRDKPMQIEADALRYDDQKQLSTFTGHVVVTKGTVLIRGNRLEVYNDADGNQFGTMIGSPKQRAFFRQKREGLNEFIEGEGETIVYDGKADTVRFVRRAEMRRLVGAMAQDVVKGSVIVYNNMTEIYTADGPAGAGGAPSAAPGRRVTAILAPRSSASVTKGADPAAKLRPSSALWPEGTSPKGTSK